jgi:hypothetical protein
LLLLEFFSKPYNQLEGIWRSFQFDVLLVLTFSPERVGIYCYQRGMLTLLTRQKGFNICYGQVYISSLAISLEGFGVCYCKIGMHGLTISEEGFGYFITTESSNLPAIYPGGVLFILTQACRRLRASAMQTTSQRNTRSQSRCDVSSFRQGNPHTALDLGHQPL